MPAKAGAPLRSITPIGYVRDLANVPRNSKESLRIECNNGIQHPDEIDR